MRGDLSKSITVGAKLISGVEWRGWVGVASAHAKWIYRSDVGGVLVGFLRWDRV